MKTHLSMGRLGAAVAGTIRVLLVAPPNFSGKGDSKMNKFRLMISAVAVALFALTFASAANAQATRTWVSGVGDDANPCSRTAPCKTFAGAISKTAAAGEIDALDPGGFGVVTITKSITIDGTGTFASILSSGSPSAVNVNDSASGSPGTANVVLRGLSINGTGTTFGTNGLNFTSGKSVTIIDCLFQNFTSNGLNVNLNTAGTETLYVVNTHVKGCGGDGLFATVTGGGQVKITLERSSFVQNNNGYEGRTGSRATARNCDFSLNNSVGVFSNATAAGFSAIEVWQSQISLNGGNGVQAGNGGNAGASGVVIAQNEIDRNGGTGVLISTGGAVNTFTNNSILANGTDGCAGCVGVGPGN
jgi:hypothetical protein